MQRVVIPQGDGLYGLGGHRPMREAIGAMQRPGPSMARLVRRLIYDSFSERSGGVRAEESNLAAVCEAGEFKARGPASRAGKGSRLSRLSAGLTNRAPADNSLPRRRCC